MKKIYSILAISSIAPILSFIPRAYASETDARIESSAKESYVFKTYLKDDDIKIKSKNGMVTLSGTVSDESHKALAKETVASLPKVSNVDNKLEIKGTQPAKNSDAWITTKVKTNLMFHRDVSAARTEVTTNSGTVTLKGEAESEKQKKLSSEYANDVDGVKEVKNEMTVTNSEKRSASKSRVRATNGEKIDDASITGQIKVSLFSHRSTSALNTNVETNDGVVTLSGKAKSKAERELVSQLSYDVYGVKDVKNGITVE